MSEFPEPISVEEALSANVPRIDVPEGAELSIGVYGNAFPRAFRVAEVVQFEELQTLGLVPDGISEEQASEAIKADGREYHEALVSADSTDRANRGCSCEGTASRADPGPARSLRRVQFQWNLAAALESPLRRPLEPGDLAVINAYAHLKRWFRRTASHLVGVTAASDINVLAGATLAMLPTVTVVHANHISIWPSGRLRLQAGSVFVRCAALNGVRAGTSPPPPPGGGGGGLPPTDPPHVPPSGAWPRVYVPGITREAALQRAKEDDI